MIDSFATAAQCAEDALADPGGLRYTHLPTLVAFIDGLRPGETPEDWSPPALLVGVRLGRLLLDLGLRDDAERVLRVLADRLESPDDEGAVDLGNALGALGASLGLLGDASDALHVALAAEGASRSDQVRTLVNLAAVNLSQGDVPLAAARVWVAHGLLAREDVSVSSRVRGLLAAVELRIGKAGGTTPKKPAAAVAELVDQAAELVDELGDGDPRSLLAVADVAVARFELALGASNAANLEEALKVLEVAAQRLAALLGADHPQALGVQADLVAAQVEAARVARSTARLERSVQLLESVARRLEVRLGPTHPRSAAALTNLVSAQVESVRVADEPGKAERTVTLLAERARRAGELFGEGHPVTRLVRASLAECRRIASGEGDARGEGTTLLLTRRDSLGDWAGEEDSAYQSYDQRLRELLEVIRRLGQLPSSEPDEYDRRAAARALARGRARPAYSLPERDEPLYPPREQSSRYPMSPRRPFDALSLDEDDPVFTVQVRAVGVDGVHFGETAKGFVPADEISVWPDTEPERVVAVGEYIDVVFMGGRNREGLMLFSMKRLFARRAREFLESVRDANGAVWGVVKKAYESGLVIDVGLPGLLSRARIQADPDPDLRSYLGRELAVKILVVPTQGDTVMVSRLAWLEETHGGSPRSRAYPPRPHLLIDSYDIPEPIHRGQLLRSSSDPRTADADWTRFARTHRRGQIVPGEVTRVAYSGGDVYVRVAEGVEGLVPVLGLAEDARNAEDVVRVGDEVFVAITGIDPDQRFIFLSLRRADRALGDDPTTAEFDPTLYGDIPHDEARARFERHRQQVIDRRRRTRGA
ncbi:S1 RNA-binding domain-containing protein [Streptomyces sp. NPDC059010]|uniref:S1 RNA-binding domain-containing protein n=1 Tax=Streptomyces sp. NPDC059010 TaxID=3346695 RepID=UPI00368CD22B